MKWNAAFNSVLLLATSASAAEPTLEERLAPHIKEIVALALAPEIVKAVLAQNALRPEGFKVMDDYKWKVLGANHAYVLSFKRSPAGERLRKAATRIISEAFVNDADGYKVAFLEKPTNWNHKGKQKHDQPMLGKTWIGPVEFDESSRAEQIQIAVPIWSRGKAVGSLVVGLSISQLAIER